MDKLELQSLFALWLILSSAYTTSFIFPTNIILIFTNCFLYHVLHGSLHPSSPRQMLPVYFSRNTHKVPRYLSSWGRRFNRKWDISGLYPHITYLLLSVFLWHSLCFLSFVNISFSYWTVSCLILASFYNFQCFPMALILVLNTTNGQVTCVESMNDFSQHALVE